MPSSTLVNASKNITVRKAHTASLHESEGRASPSRRAAKTVHRFVQLSGTLRPAFRRFMDTIRAQMKVYSFDEPSREGWSACGRRKSSGTATRRPSQGFSLASVAACAVASLCVGHATTAEAAPGPSTTRSARASERTALDRYVAAPDTNYSFKVINTIQAQGVTAHILEMTSQSWLTSNELDRPIWKHWLTITRPDQITSTKALLFITGGSNDKGPPKGPDGNAVRVATETKSVVAELRNVPNQPLIFNHDGQKRVEDDLIAYTWDKFLRTGDERWPARLPMTKSAVRAMDTVISFCGSPEGGRARIDGFVVAGGSKRGWTTWTTAAVG